jgi:8-oxo-dGTP pyrophosphatase MutT (NUDIX family)
VLDATEAVLIIWHERLQRWLQPGGHVEAGDPDPLGAARREVLEETGVDVSNVPAVLAGVDVHQIPAARGEPAHWHHDLVFGFRMATSGPTVMGEARTAWRRVDELSAVGADAALRRAVARARLWGLSPG